MGGEPRRLLAALACHAPDAAITVGCVAEKDGVVIAARVDRSGHRWAWVDLTAFGSAGARVESAPCVLDDETQTFTWIEAALGDHGTVCVCGSHVLVAAVRARVLGLAAAQPGERTAPGRIDEVARRYAQRSKIIGITLLSPVPRRSAPALNAYSLGSSAEDR